MNIYWLNMCFAICYSYLHWSYVYCGFNAKLVATHMIKLWQLKAICSRTESCFCWAPLYPMLYLLSTICAHSCYLHTHQDGQMNRIGKRIIVMSIRLVVNQSAYLWLESPRESHLFNFSASFVYRLWVNYHDVISNVMILSFNLSTYVWLISGRT
jgi:hypothetical protein